MKEKCNNQESGMRSEHKALSIEYKVLKKELNNSNKKPQASQPSNLKPFKLFKLFKLQTL
jgi:hypothetical protein